MRYEVQVRNDPAQPVMAIRTRTDLAGIQSTMGTAFGELYGYLGRKGVAPAGPPVAVYYDVDRDRGVDVEICVPVAAPVTGEGHIVPDELPAGPVAVVRHRGPYDAMEPVYEAIQSWARDEGRELAGPPRERYLNDPGSVGPQELETEVDWPVR